MNLAQAWVLASQDPLDGDAQTSSGFREKISNKFLCFDGRVELLNKYFEAAQFQVEMY